MDASQFLRDEHKRIIGLLRQAATAFHRNPYMIENFRREIIMEIEIYLRIKKEFVYSSIPESISPATFDLDRDLEDTLKDIKKLDLGNSKAFSTLFAELTNKIESCFNNEEHEIFPNLTNLSGEPLQVRQAELIKLPEYSQSRPEVVQNPHGGEQRRKKSAA